MFVLASKYHKLLGEYTSLLSKSIFLESQYARLSNKWNSLIDRINKKGGEDFLQRAKIFNTFTKEEIKTLICLCHPDKHCGSKKAEEITKKLLSMR